ncbi:TPA: AAA family ATPase [Streptococcus suis]|nr:AAA family ATPase [Streptococcus suis]HEL1919962.1 AAA family ATPase [Streptococcus suis]HEL2343989.1 AAA family ATPase [Streptococcus suis]HEL2710817.1 AAA family ATPase [Streptococcus suis]HEM3900881.1 AAA family ATPase [Streptococcus suis]
MDEQNQFNWVNFYKEFAWKLVDYKDNRAELVEKVKAIYTKTKIHMPTLEKDNQLIDIDPFTIFGLFNKQIKEENRIKILTAIAELFNLQTEIPSSFESIPVLMNQNATFYYFIGDRDEKDIDDLWELFIAALTYSKEPTAEKKEKFSHYFDLAINKKGNGNSKITMALYWIAPDFFLSLDSQNEAYVYESGEIPTDVIKKLPKMKSKISADDYFYISDSMHHYLNSAESKLKDFKELSSMAWKYSKQINQEEMERSAGAISPLADKTDTGNEIGSEEVVEDSYTKNHFLSEVYMTEEEYDQLTSILQMKKNIILQGAPGVGKTFVAERLAFSLMGKPDLERVMTIQFHQSYSYEDFIMGFRPSTSGFELRRGAFYTFCKKAESDKSHDYFFIIDEINRGNLSKIFGELFMLIENDKRGKSLQLLYSDEQFSIPENLYIIGMMNTADRSLALLDYALRRRFAFFDIKPGFSTAGFKDYQTNLKNEKFDRLISCVEKLNQAISTEEVLGDSFCIGHSYFCGLSAEVLDQALLEAIVEYELIPLLKEYWFDEPTKIHDWSSKLRSTIQ